MRELTIGDTKVRVRGTPLALLYYRQEFRSDIVGDVLKMRELKDDPSKLEAITLLQITWAMARADNGFGRSFPSFVEWLSGIGEFDITDDNFIGPLLEEAVDGFFRGRRGYPGR